MFVPFVDLQGQYRALQPALQQAIDQALHEFNFVKGKQVAAFEEQFSTRLKSPHCIATGNCTDALFAALKGLGVSAGDEVITPAFSWISSAETISLCQARPVFADVHPETYTIDPSLVEDKITARTRGIIAVHLYGQAAHGAALRAICEKHGLFLLEDCAQAQLTSENGRYAGTLGHAGAFSFYPTKNLGAYGDAGCVVTNDETLADTVRRLANHGALAKDDHLMEGFNSRMDSLQAAVLLAKLPWLTQWNKTRMEHAARYNQLLQNIPEVTVPFVRPGTEHTFHIYAIRCKKRDELKEFLAGKNVQTIIHYPQALPNLAAYKYLHHKPSDFEVANLLQEEVLSLPVCPELVDEQIDFVGNCVKEFYSL